MTPAELVGLRVALELEQLEIALLLQVDRRTVSRWELGRCPVSQDKLFWVELLRDYSQLPTERQRSLQRLYITAGIRAVWREVLVQVQS